MNLTHLRAWTEDFIQRVIADGHGRKSRRFHLGGESAARQVLARIQALEIEHSGPTTTLPTTPAQYLFAIGDSPVDLWTLTAHGWFVGGVRYDSPLVRKAYTTWQRVVRGAK